MVRGALWLRWLWLALPWLVGCPADLQVDEDDHPCSACRPCEICVPSGSAVTCIPDPNVYELACDEGGDLVQLDACGDLSGVVQSCEAPKVCMPELSRCACEGNWSGPDCSECPVRFDPERDCAECSNHWTGADCRECPGNWDPAQQCNACRNAWQGSDCGQCPPNFDADTDCAACRNHWTGDDCTTCPSNFRAETDCTECAPHWMGENCDQCVGNRDLTQDCAVCRPGFEDEGDDCATCQAGLELSGNECLEVCGNGVVTESEQCDDGNAAGGDGCEACQVIPLQVAPNGSDGAKVASGPDGRFVVVWERSGDIRGRLYDADGFPLTDAFTVNGADGSYGDAQVAMFPGGEFVVVWRDAPLVLDPDQILMRRYDDEANPLGPQQRVSAASHTAARSPLLAAAPDGRFVVTYSYDGRSWIRRFGPTGELVSGESDDEVFPQDIAWDPVANGLVRVSVREITGTATISDKVWLTPGGLLDPSEVSDHDQSEPRLAIDDSGSVAVVWEDYRDGDTRLRGYFDGAVYALPAGAQGGYGSALDLTWLGTSGRVAISLRRGTDVYVAAFEPGQTERVAPTELPDSGYDPSIAPRPDGGVVVVWRYNGIHAMLLDPDMRPYPPSRD